MSDPFQKRIAQVQAIGQRLSQFEQEQKESLASVSHDIRVPLASAALSIKQQLGPQHPTSMQLSRALSATEEYLQTSRAQLLDLNTFQELDLGAVLQQALDDIYPLLQPKNLRLQSQTLDEPVWVHGHFDSLCRVVTNVLSNAIRYAPEHSTLQVALRIKPGQAQIDITDGGPGIAAEDLERIFERFVRLRRNTPSTEAGAGLGLHFVQTVLRKHGGSVKVQSQPGQTTFSLQLPRTE